MISNNSLSKSMCVSYLQSSNMSHDGRSTVVRLSFDCRSKLLKLVTVLALLLTVGVGNVWGETIRTGWTLCTSPSDLTSGGTYIIAYSTSSSSFSEIHPMRNEYYGDCDGSATSYIYAGSTSGESGSTTFNLSSGSTGDTSPYEVTIVTGSSSGKIAIRLSNGKYIGFYNTGKNNLRLYDAVNTNSSFTPTVSSSKFSLANVQNTSRYFKYNTSSPRFSNYASNTQNTSGVYIYKKSVTCTLSSISLNTTSVQKTFCVGESFNYTGLVTTATYTGGCANATVTPTSVSSPNMASAGEKTVTVSYTEGGVTKTATYTITVQAKYTVTWMVNGSSYSAGTPTTQVCPGSHVTSLPTAPDPASYCGEVFAGWTDDEYSGDSAPTHLYKIASEFPNATSNQVFYAVFADYVD